MFDGFDSAGNYGLWVTNGTAAGTYELTLSGAYAGGIFGDYFTSLNGQVLFEGANAAHQFGLWVTNGTAAGTHELTGISGASAGGLNPEELTVSNNEVVFAGTDTAGARGLWVTNGTATKSLASAAPGVATAIQIRLGYILLVSRRSMVRYCS
jgi:ELWxxDGT repeat protein